MNIYQEALGRFKVVAQNDWTNNYQKCKDEEKTIHIGNYRMFEIDGEAIKTLQELIDKENPKAPIPTPMAHLYGTYNCPNCKNPLPMKHNALKKKAPRLYCDRCGQKIDWDKVRD